MLQILFKPFDLKKWLILGFCVFLAQCGSVGGGGGGGGGGGFPPPTTGKTAPLSGNPTRWIDDNMILVIALACAGMVILIGIVLLVTWVSSRGKFLFIDAVVKNRAAVREPWKEYRREGNSLFLFRIVLGVFLLTYLTFAAGIPLLIAIPDFRSEIFGFAGVFAIIAFGILMLGFVVFTVAASFILNNFVVPTMYHRRVQAIEGWKIAWRELIRGHLGPATLLFLMMLLLGLPVGALVMSVTIITCCCTIVPYVGTVILLPIPVFFLCYTLEYIQQFGDDWMILPE